MSAAPTARRLMWGLPLLQMSEKERRLLDFIVGQGRIARWTSYQGNNVGQMLAVQMDWDEFSARKAITALKRRGWLMLAWDMQNRPTLVLTDELAHQCELARERQRVRSALGYRLCNVYAVTDERLDKIADLANHMQEPRRWPDRARQVARTMYSPTGGPDVLASRRVGRRIASTRGDTKPVER